MNDSNIFSHQQVLDSIQEMRASLRSDRGGPLDNRWDESTPFWEEGASPSDGWFADCEFDPRETSE